MNKFLIFLVSIFFAFGARAQVDSIHFQFQDTLLKAGTQHVFLMKVRENISGALGFQFCIQFDPVNINFNQIKKYYVSGWTDDNMNIYPLGNPNLIACAVDVITAPYNGSDLLELEFNVVNDCRVKDVIRVMSAYRFKEGDSYSYSEMFFENDTYPIATEYLPFITAGRAQVEKVPTQVYPNPSSDKVSLEFKSNKTGNMPMSIFDNNGRLIRRSEVFVKEGQNSINLSKDQLGASGSYIIQLDLGGRVVSAKAVLID